MATYRIGIGSEFQLKDQAAGIGNSTTGLGNLIVAGRVKASGISNVGVNTFSRYSGLISDEVSGDNITLTGEHLTTSDIVVGSGSTFTVSVGATVDTGAVRNMTIGSHFSVPTGNIEDRPEVPIEGTVRFNINLNTLEFYNGYEWKQFTASSANGRCVIAHGYKYPFYPNKYDVINIPTLGNAVYFGDFAYTGVRDKTGCGSRTRGLFGGGLTGGGGRRQEIDYVTIASTGNAFDFGDLFQSVGHNGSCSTQTRGLWTGGYGPSGPSTTTNTDYVEISTLGNGQDFGDLALTTGYNSAFSSATRGFCSGGSNTPLSRPLHEVQMFTVASKGNAIEFAKLTSPRSRPSSLSNSVMGFTAGDQAARHRTIDRVIMSSGGEAVAFGETNTATTMAAGSATQTRGIWAGGQNPSTTDSIEYYNLQSGGNTKDFGNLTTATTMCNATSDSHGGLGGY